MNPILAFIESNTTGSGYEMIRKSHRRGFAPWLLSSRPEIYQGLDPSTVDVRVVDSLDANALVAECGSLNGLAGIWSTANPYTGIAALVAQERGLPGPNPVAVRDCLDKRLQRETLASAGISQPEFHYAISPEEASLAFRAFDGPAVVKPIKGSGKVGVRFCETESETYRHVANLTNNSRERSVQISEGFLVEQFVSGREFSVELFHGRAIGVTLKASFPPHFVEEGHVFPAPIPTSLAERLQNVAEEASRALGLEWGPCHIELKSDEDEIWIIEVNARLAGGNIPQLINEAIGVDLLEACLDVAVGLPPVLLPKRARASAIQFLFAPSEGVVERIEGLSTRAGACQVVDVQMYLEPGAKLKLHGDFRDRIGHVIAAADSPDEALSEAAAAAKMVSIKMEASI